MIICLNNGFNILFNKGLAKVADIVATTVNAKVVDTVEVEGKYFSTLVNGSYKTRHSFVSSIYLKPVTFSVPAVFKSPILGLFFLGSGHSTLLFGSSGTSLLSVFGISGC